jgi:hypothetical protein
VAGMYNVSAHCNVNFFHTVSLQLAFDMQARLLDPNKSNRKLRFCVHL